MIEDDEVIACRSAYYSSIEERSYYIDKLIEWKEYYLENIGKDYVLLEDIMEDRELSLKEGRILTLTLVLSNVKLNQNEKEADFWEDFQGFCKERTANVTK